MDNRSAETCTTYTSDLWHRTEYWITLISRGVDARPVDGRPITTEANPTYVISLRESDGRRGTTPKTRPRLAHDLEAPWNTENLEEKKKMNRKKKQFCDLRDVQVAEKQDERNILGVGYSFVITNICYFIFFFSYMYIIYLLHSFLFFFCILFFLHFQYDKNHFSLSYYEPIRWKAKRSKESIGIIRW